MLDDRVAGAFVPAMASATAPFPRPYPIRYHRDIDTVTTHARFNAQDALNMPIRHAGFTMIELMVVVAIVAILALMAAPGFQDQIVRDQINNALPLADIAKTPNAAAWAMLQTFPPDNASAGLPPADNIVNNAISSVTVQDGAIHITFGNRANGVITGKILTLRAAVVEDAPVVPVTWVCGYAEAPAKMTIRGQNHTNIPASFLPFACRSRATGK